VKKYENFFIVDPDLADDKVSGLEEKLQKVVAGEGGAVLSYVPWGKKKLAYPVKKHARGQYVLMQFACPATGVAELERNLRLDERVLKFITVKLEDRFDPEREAENKAATPSRFEEEEGSSGEAAQEGAAREDAGSSGQDFEKEEED